MVIFTGEICTYSGRPIVLDDKNPQIARCRKCSAPYLSQSWFAAGEKCAVAGCGGKAADFSQPKIKDSVGDVCPFLPFEQKREGDLVPARCLKAKCMLYDAVEKRCALGEMAYALASQRQGSRQMRNHVSQTVGASTNKTANLLNALVNASRGTEGAVKGLVPEQEKVVAALGNVASILGDVKTAIAALAGDQQQAAAGFEQLARAVEASGVSEQVRARRDARLAARAALRDGRPGASVRLLERALKRGPDEAVAGDLATAYVKAGLADRSTEVLDKVLAENPGYTPARITLAALKLKEGDPAAAESLLKDAPDPSNPVLRAELAYARACAAYAVGRSEDAVDLLNQTLDEDPWHAAAAAALEDLRARRTGAPPPDAAALAVTVANVVLAAGDTDDG